jgi:hypothetical protein
VHRLGYSLRGRRAKLAIHHLPDGLTGRQVIVLSDDRLQAMVCGLGGAGPSRRAFIRRG